MGALITAALTWLIGSLLGLAALVAHACLMLALAPVLVGVVRWIEARLLGRVGASPLQPWRDLIRLARKQQVIAFNASPVFTAAPVVAFAATLAAAALVPGAVLGMTTAPIADLLVVIGLLALARCAMALAALDIGTGFGGLGAAREMTFAAFAEPAMLLIAFTLALLAGTTNLDAIAMLLREASVGLRVSLGLALVAAITVGLAENGRLPVDNPASHLELTMIHEAMLLEYGGRPLALIEGTAALKLLIWFSLIATIFVPFGLATPTAAPLVWALALPVWILKLVAMALAMAGLEVSIAKMRIFRVPEFLGVALLLGLLAAVFLFVSQGLA